MIFTPLDFIIKWLNDWWVKMNDVRKESKGTFQLYLLGIIALLLILPAYLLNCWILDVDLFSLDFETLRIYLAISTVGVLFYFMGGAYSVYIYRKALKESRS